MPVLHKGQYRLICMTFRTFLKIHIHYIALKITERRLIIDYYEKELCFYLNATAVCWTS